LYLDYPLESTNIFVYGPDLILEIFLRKGIELNDFDIPLMMADKLTPNIPAAASSVHPTIGE